MESGGSVSGQRARQRDLARDLEVLDGLLNTLTEVLDIRDVFDRVSQLVQPVLPHDVMGVVEINASGDRAKLHAGAGGKIPENYEVPIPDRKALQHPEAIVLDDVQSHPNFRKGPAITAGMKSALSAPMLFHGRLQGVVNF